LGATPITTNTTPFAISYGYWSPMEKPKLYQSLLTTLGEAIDKKFAYDAHGILNHSSSSLAKNTGCIINTPSHFVEGTAGFELLIHAATALKGNLGDTSCLVNVILVLSHERLYSDLKRHYSQHPTMQVAKLPKSGGVVNREKSFRRQAQMRKIREYFYGFPHIPNQRSELFPYSNIIPFHDIQVRRVSEGTLAPNSALPLGMDRKVSETQLVKVEPGDILLHSILAVVHVDLGDKKELGQEEESDVLLKSPITGFIYV
jgi:polyribonucleotide 5'-hydroxyl-kinase